MAEPLEWPWVFRLTTRDLPAFPWRGRYKIDGETEASQPVIRLIVDGGDLVIDITQQELWDHGDLAECIDRVFTKKMRELQKPEQDIEVYKIAREHEKRTRDDDRRPD